jgi:hypothetical protein
MKKILVLAEGQTEETFIKEVLAPSLLPDISLSVTILKTKRLVDAPDSRGGHGGSYEKIRHDLLLLLQGKKDIWVTSMIDYYGLPGDTPGLKNRPAGDCYQQVNHVEREIENDINNRLLKVHLTLHEFEAYAFVDAKLLLHLFPDARRAVRDLEAIRQQYDSPEHINLGRETAPSKRILAHLPAYRKTLHGPLLTSELTIDGVAASCPHFKEWVDWLRS